MSYNSRNTNLESDYAILIFEYKAHPVIFFFVFVVLQLKVSMYNNKLYKYITESENIIL